MEKEERFLGDRQMRIHYAKVEREISDRNSIRTHGYKEGFAEGMEIGIVKGRAEGLTEARKEVAQNHALKMLTAGLPIELVHKITDLDFDEIARLRQ